MRLTPCSKLSTGAVFQSTHPHGVRPFSVINFLYFYLGFNPRTRTGCDSDYISHMTMRPSFNPRTRTGCDTSGKTSRMSMQVSIHAPARGATDALASVEDALRFQSTHPHGVRRRPASSFLTRRCFNPRTRTGCDGKAVASFADEAEFQSTHPHGVRLPCRITLYDASGFQSTHPHGVRRRSLALR